jgi:anti-sigma B factor antagonist
MSIMSVRTRGVCLVRRAGSPFDVHEPSGTSVAIGEFRIEEERPRKGTVVLAIYGETDLHVATELRDYLTAAIDGGASFLVVDLSGVTFIDSMGLGALLGGMKRLRSSGGQFRLVVPRGEIRRIFELTLLDRVFVLDPTREDALAPGAPSARGD